MDPNYQPQSAPTGQEIEQAKNVFQRLADAIVQMTSLHEQVQQMQSTMNQMKDDLERLRRTNDSLEEALSHSRAARQELETKNAELQRNLDEAQRSQRNAETDANHWQELAKTYERERDEARQRAESESRRADTTQHELTEAKDKLDAIQQGFQSIFGNVQPKPMQEMSERIAHATGSGQVQSQPESIHPQTEEQPKAEQPKRIYSNEPGFTWDKPTSYDDERRDWYNN